MDTETDVDQLYASMVDHDEWLWRDPPGRTDVREVSDLVMAWPEWKGTFYA